MQAVSQIKSSSYIAPDTDAWEWEDVSLRTTDTLGAELMWRHTLNETALGNISVKSASSLFTQKRWLALQTSNRILRSPTNASQVHNYINILAIINSCERHHAHIYFERNIYIYLSIKITNICMYPRNVWLLCPGHSVEPCVLWYSFVCSLRSAVVVYSLVSLHFWWLWLTCVDLFLFTGSTTHRLHRVTFLNSLTVLLLKINSITIHKYLENTTDRTTNWRLSSCSTVNYIFTSYISLQPAWTS